MACSTSIKNYYQLAKPGIVYGNLLTAMAGFLFGSRWHISLISFFALITGTALIIASGCVFNNYLDRGVDAKMNRTKKRGFVTGEVSVLSGLLYGALLCVLGFGALHFTNWLTVWVGIVGFVGYVAVYGWAKRHTEYGTLVGTVPGAASLVAGYTAATNRFGTAAIILFLIMLAWQMVHFYSIAIYRMKDYVVAGIPVWPAKYGVSATRRQIILFMVLFIAVSPLLTIFGYIGLFCGIGLLMLGLRWLWLGMAGRYAADEATWARQIFKFSLVALLVLCGLIALGPILP